MRGFLPAFLSLACGGWTAAAWAQTGAPPLSSTASPPPIGDCPTGPYIVFFDWGKAEVTAGARPILDNAIAALQCLRGEAALTVNGHADRSGPAARNLSPSRRRAAAVAAYLASHVVGRGAIAVQAFGERRSLVETKDGVQEAQNRYVEVVFGELREP
jgi:OmpA-OmpF porin, OOP family